MTVAWSTVCRWSAARSLLTVARAIAVLNPRGLPPRSGIEYIRFSSSSVVDKPSAGVAVRLTLAAGKETVESARIVLGCVGATPVRARKAEALLTDKKVTAELVEEAAVMASQECSPTSDLRGSEYYKRAVVRTLVKRAASKAYERALGN